MMFSKLIYYLQDDTESYNIEKEQFFCERFKSYLGYHLRYSVEILAETQANIHNFMNVRFTLIEQQQI